MAYQFVHMEVYSRKGRNGRNVDFILAEAERRPDACLHVTEPVRPELIFGVEVAEVRRLHNERAETATVTTRTGKSRRIRTDQNTLVAIVASHPATTEAVSSTPAIAHAVANWEALTVEWLRTLYGDQLVSVIRHVDETHPHLHAFVLPDDIEMRARRLHPGQEAKATIMTAALVEAEDRKTLNRRADAAYRASMRAWQDSYWQTVGLPCGLARLGPGRRRLSRLEWQAEKKQMQAIQEAHADAALARVAAAAHRVEAIRLHKAAEARIGHARSVVLTARQEGKRILESARSRATRLRSIGSQIRSLWDGLRRSVVEARIRQAVAGEVAEAHKRAEAERHRAVEETRKRRDAERAHEATVAAVHALGRERDMARRRLDALERKAGAIIPNELRRIP